MKPKLAAATALLMTFVAADASFAQKPGGILQMPDFASPASMSMHEESTITADIPLMGMFNNLVVFAQHVAQNSLASIVPDLASDWSFDETGTALTFPPPVGVRPPRPASCAFPGPLPPIAGRDASRPVLLYSRFATCMQPRLKGLTTMINSRFNGWRMEDVWLDN